MYLLWFVIYCIVIAFVLNVLFRTNFGDSVTISQLGIIVILFLCYVLNILQLGVYLVLTILTLSLAFALILAIRQKILISAIKNIVGISFIAYVIFLCIVYFTVRKNTVSCGDELCYWASLPKVLFQYNGALQLKAGFQVYCADYIPAMPLYLYFLERINGVFEDGLLFFGYAALSGALILPAGNRLRKWYEILELLAILWLTPLFFYNTEANDWAIFYKTIYVDPVMGIAVGSFIWLIMQAPWKGRLKWGQFTLYACFICLLKSSGIAFVLVAIITLFIYWGLYEKRILKKWWIWGGISFPIVLYEIWHITLSRFGIHNTVNYKILDVMDAGFIKEFVHALFTKNILATYITALSKYCTFIVLFIFLSLLLFAFMRWQLKRVKESGKESPRYLIGCSYIMVWIQCIIYVLGLYALCAGAWKHQLLSFPRYICTILEMMICFMGCTFLCDFTLEKIALNKNNFFKPVSVLVILFLLIAPLKEVSADYSVYPQYVYDDYNAICETFVDADMSSDDKWSRLIILIDEKEKYEDWMKSLYGHLKNNLAYTLISSDIQVNHKIYYTSQMNIFSDDDNVVCSLVDENWIPADYILWCHGNYPDMPIVNWELYRVQSVESKKMSMSFMEKASRNLAN